MLDLLTLVQATPAQILASRRRTFPHWACDLTELQYLSRDAQLDLLPHASNGKMITWCVSGQVAARPDIASLTRVLVPRDDLTTLDFKCSCETFRRNALVRRADAQQPEDAVGYGLASVFTPPQNRGQGFARHMMSLLHWVLAPPSALPAFPASWGAPPPAVPQCGNAAFSVLYSDVGDFYSTAGPAIGASGWIIRDALSTVWDVPADGIPPAAALDVTWLDESEAEAMWRKDAQVMRTDMARQPSGRAAFTCLPDNGVGGFTIRRTAFFLPGQTCPMPTKWGVALTGAGVQAYVTWTLDVRPPPPTMLVTRLRASPDTFPQLLPKLLEAARECGMEKVEVWNVPSDLLDSAHFMGGKTEVRTEHLNAFKWYGPEPESEVEWMFNEKFCWC